jgi:putative phosphoribosyl transferase
MRETTKTVSVEVPVGSEALSGDLTLPREAHGIVVFAHGSGSSRHSARNRFVARVLEQRGLATLLTDLLTRDEEIADRHTGHWRFNINLLAERLVDIIDWLHRQPQTAGLPIGLFGASTGGGAALVAAARRPRAVAAVVSRGGRPDLAGMALAHVSSPTLLIVGARDSVVIDLNQHALERMRGYAVLDIVPGATHLFEEPGTLERVAELAAGFFEARLVNLHAHADPASDR